MNLLRARFRVSKNGNFQGNSHCWKSPGIAIIQNKISVLGAWLASVPVSHRGSHDASITGARNGEPMRNVKISKPRPWLTSTGVEIPTVELQEISKSWDNETWGNYLSWYESGRRESLIQPWAYDKICEEQSESLFHKFGQDPTPEHRQKCEAFLNQIRPDEARILRKIFFDGRTIREIAAEVNLPKSTVQDIKNRALFCSKWGNCGDNPDARRSMRGPSSFSEDASLWDESLEHPLNEARSYDPGNHGLEFALLKTKAIREALLSLPESSQRLLYLRYWCGLSVNSVAHLLGHGVNVVEQVEAAAISKVKRNAMSIRFNEISGGAQ